MSVGVQITTASMSAAASIASMVRMSQPYCVAIASAAGAMASATATSRASGLPVIARACTLPMAGSVRTEALAETAIGSSPRRKRAMSKS